VQGSFRPKTVANNRMDKGQEHGNAPSIARHLIEVSEEAAKKLKKSRLATKELSQVGNAVHDVWFHELTRSQKRF